MKITKEEVEHVAHLARLELDEDAIERFAGQIGDILAYVDKLKKGGLSDEEEALNLLQRK